MAIGFFKLNRAHQRCGSEMIDAKLPMMSKSDLLAISNPNPRAIHAPSEGPLSLWRTKDTFYRDVLTFEKRLPADLVRIDYKKLAIWSLIRMPAIEKLSQELSPPKQTAKNVVPQSRFARLASMARQSGICAFVVGMIRGHDASVIIRANSFSLLGEQDGVIQFRNRNLQEIHDQLVRERVKFLVIVSDLEGFRLPSKLTTALVYPGLLNIVVRKLLAFTHARTANDLLCRFARNLPLDEHSLRNMILNSLATFGVWSLILKFIRPSRIYYESPHNSFEPEVAAAKREHIKTVEIYHGAITQVEATYFQNHLDFGGLIHGVCDEYLSPSVKQTRFLSRHSDKYSRITTIPYRSPIKFSTRERLRLIKTRKRPATKRTKLLIIAGLYDGAIADVMGYLRENRLPLMKQYKTVTLRLHPADSRKRWVAVSRAFPMVGFSTLPLIDDIVGATELVLGNTSVALQLHSLNVGFKGISTEELI